MCSFFFSSRRRHTRSKRDWSSDVCSSDLVNAKLERPMNRGDRRFVVLLAPTKFPARSADSPCPKADRSEERRVGKDCRSPRAAYHAKNKTRITKAAKPFDN